MEDTPYFPLMITGIEQECRACGMEMTMYNLDRQSSNFKEELKWLSNDKAAGIIFLGTELLDEDLEMIRSLPSPFVMIDYWREDMSFDAVLINNADAARMATEYLIGNGHKEIGYLQGKFPHQTFPFQSHRLSDGAAQSPAAPEEGACGDALLRYGGILCGYEGLSEPEAQSAHCLFRGQRYDRPGSHEGHGGVRDPDPGGCVGGGI